MISKELLSEVLGLKVWKVLGSTENILRYCIYPNKGDEPSEYMFPINIYELVHKCKEWGRSKGYQFKVDDFGIMTKVTVGTHWRSLHHEVADIDDSGEIRDEVAIFKACEWVLKQKENNE